jgi:hypothetical protein
MTGVKIYRSYYMGMNQKEKMFLKSHFRYNPNNYLWEYYKMTNDIYDFIEHLINKNVIGPNEWEGTSLREDMHNHDDLPNTHNREQLIFTGRMKKKL